MSDVVLHNVARVFPGGVTAVAQLDLAIEDGEFLVLVGPSGCGKSTTLRLIAGLEELTTGEIRIGGRRVDRVASKDRNIAMVFQNYALYPHMTVRENMAFGLKLRHTTSRLAGLLWRVVRPAVAARITQKREWVDQQVIDAARTLGIEHLLDRLPRLLSGGEQQRVALGRAIVRQPAAFLLDEPLSNLDAKLRVQMRHELKRLHRQMRATMIYVTHDQVEALTMGQRVAVMDRGVLQQLGTPREVYDRPRNRFVAGFIGSPPMNFVAGAIKPEAESQPSGSTEGIARVRFHGQGLTLLLEGEIAKRMAGYVQRPVVLGVRPEDVRPIALGQHDDARRGDAGTLATVSHLESLGDSTVAYLEIQNETEGQQSEAAGEPATLLSKLPAREVLQAGETVTIEMDINRVHFFDPQSGENIGPHGEITKERN